MRAAERISQRRAPGQADDSSASVGGRRRRPPRRALPHSSAGSRTLSRGTAPALTTRRQAQRIRLLTEQRAGDPLRLQTGDSPRCSARSQTTGVPGLDPLHSMALTPGRPGRRPYASSILRPSGGRGLGIRRSLPESATASARSIVRSGPAAPPASTSPREPGVGGQRSSAAAAAGSRCVRFSAPPRPASCTAAAVVREHLRPRGMPAELPGAALRDETEVRGGFP